MHEYNGKIYLSHSVYEKLKDFVENYETYCTKDENRDSIEIFRTLTIKSPSTQELCIHYEFNGYILLEFITSDVQKYFNGTVRVEKVYTEDEILMMKMEFRELLEKVEVVSSWRPPRY